MAIVVERPVKKTTVFPPQTATQSPKPGMSEGWFAVSVAADQPSFCVKHGGRTAGIEREDMWQQLAEST